MTLIAGYDRDSAITSLDEILARGLTDCIGERDGQMCVESAICAVLGEPHGDEPTCVDPAVRAYGVRINDARWSSAKSRSEHLRDFAIAQLGSADVVNGLEFAESIAMKTVTRLLPRLFRYVKSQNAGWTSHVKACETARDLKDARAAAAAAAYAADTDAAYAAAAYAADTDAAYAAAAYAAAYAADAATDASASAYAAAAAEAAEAAASADAYAYTFDEKYLILSVSLAVETLRELKSPGCAWLDA